MSSVTPSDGDKKARVGVPGDCFRETTTTTAPPFMAESEQMNLIKIRAYLMRGNFSGPAIFVSTKTIPGDISHEKGAPAPGAGRWRRDMNLKRVKGEKINLTEAKADSNDYWWCSSAAEEALG